MRSSLKTLTVTLSLAASLFLASGQDRLGAHPLAQVTSDEAIYQRVKKLEDYGLLDPQDQALLDQGKVVTRLELAFYTEKAKIRISAPGLGQATPVAAAPSLPAPALPAPALPEPGAPTLPEAQPSIPPPAAPVAVPPAVKQEVDNLLKELEQESAFIRARLTVDDERIQKQMDEMDRMKAIEDKVDAAWKKANKVSGSPNFSTHGTFLFEHLHLSPLDPTASAASTFRQNATQAANQINIGMWSDLGGKGSISIGLSGYVPFSNASAGPASIAAYSPKIQFIFDGPLGRWDTNATVEGYAGDTTLGDFTRGVFPSTLKRYERPFEVKNFDDPPNKNAKLWDDYMNSIGYVASASYASGSVQSTSDRVFDGVYMMGSALPLVSPDARMTFLIGRMGTSASQTQQWEKAVKYSQPWLDGKLRTAFSFMAVDEFFVTPTHLNMRSYAGDISINLKPVRIGLQGAFSTLYTGVDSSHPLDPQQILGPAGQASISFYPFNVYAFAISDYFYNFQSKVLINDDGVRRLGSSIAYGSTTGGEMFGAIGEVDNLISNRWGWRANIGWNGRKADWLKPMPAFFDDFTVNLDVAQKTEFTTNLNPEGYNAIEPFNMVTFYYPDDEGLWGGNMYGGYSSPDYPVRQAFSDNIRAIRNDGFTTTDIVRYQFQLTSEEIPLLGVVGGQPLDPGGNPFVPANSPGPVNTYYTLPHKKAFSYITLTTKWQLNKLFSVDRPIYASVFFTRNRVSGVADPSITLPAGIPSSIPDLFTQFTGDATVMVNLIKNVNLLGNYAIEDWESSFTWPLMNYHTESIGAGLAWDIPWGGGKLEFRYKHLTFHDQYVPANGYQGDQIFSTLQVAF